MQGCHLATAGDATTGLRLRQQLVSLAGDFCDRPTEFADSVMALLSSSGLVEGEDGLRLLSPHGAALCELARTPSATLRELGARLGWSEAYVHKVLVRLANSGFVSRTRVGQRVAYRIAREEVLRTVDSRRLLVLFVALAGQIDVEVLDSSGEDR